MLDFDWPWVFAFLALPLAVIFLLPRSKREDAALRVPFYQRAENAIHEGHSLGQQKSWIKAIVLATVWVLLVSAAAKPQWIGEAISIPTSGRDLLVAVDISGSMKTADMVIDRRRIQRLSLVKYVVGEFLERRVNDRIGLILFADEAYLQSPLTFDRKTVKRLLEEAQLGFAGQQTAIGDAIGLAIKRLKDRPDSQRVLILLTDGTNNAGEVKPRKAAELAKQAGVKIYTVGVAAARQNNLISQIWNSSPDIDEETLRYIAKTTGGQYFRAHDPAELLRIYALFDKLEPIEQDNEFFRPTRSLFFWPLGLAIILSFFIAVVAIMLPKILNRAVS